MSIPFGAIVHEATRRAEGNRQAALRVRFSRRSRDGTYAMEEEITVRGAEACRLVAAALQRGEGRFWGEWFGLPE